MNTRKLLLALLVVIAYFSVGFAVQSVHTDNVSALKFQGRSAPSLSPAGSGVLYFDGTHFQASENGGAYATLGGGGGLTVGTSAVTSGTGGRVFYETAGNKLGEISGATSDGTTLTLVAPVLGAATATSVNGLVVSTTTGTFTLTNAKTFAVTNSLTLSGTDSTVMTFPGTSATIA